MLLLFLCIACGFTACKSCEFSTVIHLCGGCGFTAKFFVSLFRLHSWLNLHSSFLNLNSEFLILSHFHLSPDFSITRNCETQLPTRMSLLPLTFYLSPFNFQFSVFSFQLLTPLFTTQRGPFAPTSSFFTKNSHLTEVRVR